MKKISKSIVLCLPALLLAGCDNKPGTEIVSDFVTPINEVSKEAFESAVQSKIEASSLMKPTDTPFDYSLFDTKEIEMFNGSIANGVRTEETRYSSLDTYLEKYDADKKILSTIGGSQQDDIDDGEETIYQDAFDRTYYDTDAVIYRLDNVEKTYQKLYETEETALNSAKQTINAFYEDNVQLQIDMAMGEGKYYIDGDLFTFDYKDPESEETYATVQFVIEDKSLVVNYKASMVSEENDFYSGLADIGKTIIKKEDVTLKTPSTDGYQLEPDKDQFILFSNEVSVDVFQDQMHAYMDYYTAKACTGTHLNNYKLNFEMSANDYSYTKEDGQKTEESKFIYSQKTDACLDGENNVFYLLSKEYENNEIKPYKIETQYLYYDDAIMEYDTRDDGEIEIHYTKEEGTLSDFCECLQELYLPLAFTIMEQQTSYSAHGYNEDKEYYIDDNVYSFVIHNEETIQIYQMTFGDKIIFNFSVYTEIDDTEQYMLSQRSGRAVQEFVDTKVELPNMNGLTPTLIP